jgi:hypothetical protein
MGSRSPVAKAGALTANRGPTSNLSSDDTRDRHLARRQSDAQALRRPGRGRKRETGRRTLGGRRRRRCGGLAPGYGCSSAARECDTVWTATLTAPLAHAWRRRLQHPCEPLPLFGDSGLDRSADRCDQGHFCRRAQVQGGTHLLRKHYFRGFYRLGGAVGCGLHDAPPGIVGERRKDAPAASINNPDPTKERHRTNIDWDSTTPRPSRRTDRRQDRICPNAVCPSGRATRAGASPSRSFRQPARRAVGQRRVR